MAPAPAPAVTPALAARAPEPWARRWLPLIIVAIVAGAAYVSSVHGAFVYDDDRQIVQNIFLQDTRFFWRAMASEVWGFRPTPSGVTTSSYWRPTFVLWLMANYRLFGTSSAVPWHVTSVLLHVVASVLSVIFVRRLGARPLIAAAIGLIFAVHPCHVESVSWISGSPDPLLTVPALLAWILALGAREGGGRTRTKWLGSYALFAVALLAKETAVLLPLAFAVSFFATDRASPTTRSRWLRALDDMSPYVGLVVLYFLGRLGVFGPGRLGGSPAGQIVRSACTAPAIGAFYIRQCVWPVTIAPCYPLRVVEPGAVGFANLVLPLAVVVAVTAFSVWRGRRDPLAWCGLALAATTLAPTMNVAVFGENQLVHDRYLYLPLLGGLMIVVPAVADLIARLPRATRPRADTACLALCAILSVPLAWQTVRATASYRSDLALWEWAARVDAESDFAWRQYANQLLAVGRVDEAHAAYDRAVELNPAAPALLGRADVALAQLRFEDAQRDCVRAIELQPGNVGAYERLAVCFDALGDPERAIAVWRQARQTITPLACGITERLALFLQRAGRFEDAATELEAYRTTAMTSDDPRGRMVLYRLGIVYGQLDRPREAAAAFRDYLKASAPLTDPATIDARADAERRLAALGG